jgi:hypothetical protein
MEKDGKTSSEEIKTETYQRIEKLGDYIQARNNMAEIRHLLSFIQGRSKQLNSLRINLPNEKDNLEKWVSCTQIKFEEVISYLESSGGNHIVDNNLSYLLRRLI